MDVNQIINSDCIEGMKSMPDKSVQCCVTSPPYFGLRDYGHEGQIGLEETPEQFVAKLVDVFREVKRVLKDDGTLWLNLGDSYAGSGKGAGDKTMDQRGCISKTHHNIGDAAKIFKSVECKPKDLIGIPWMVAFALRADGWYLRQDIIWHKPNPMPESVTDRCTKSHEYIFLLSKSAKYYYDADAIKVVSAKDIGTRHTNNQYTNYGAYNGQSDKPTNKGLVEFFSNGEANKRSVWTVTTKPYSEAHFATYPPDLIVDCIKAGSRVNDIILDPFMGAGTTAMVARKLDRRYIGFELNPEYIRIAQNRLQTELGVFV